MIGKMLKYSLILLPGEQDAFLERVRQAGMFDMARSEKPVDKHSQDMLEEALRLKRLCEGLARVKGQDAAGEIPDGDTADIVENALAELDETQQSLKEVRRDIEERTIWGSFDRRRLEKLEEAGCRTAFHVVDAKAFAPEWADEYPIEVIAQKDKRVWFVSFGTPKDVPCPDIPLPEGDVTQSRTAETRLEKKKEELTSLLTALKGRSEELEGRYNSLLSDFDLYLAGKAAIPAAENYLSTIVGYVPIEEGERMDSLLEAEGVFYIREEAVTQDNPPIRLKNRWFARQFEVLTNMYGSPVYDEFDPTPILGPFFLLFFALCMGDAGYGLLLVAIGFILKKKVPSMAELGPLVVMLGIGTFLIGIVLHTFFGINIANASWVPESLKSVMITGTIAGYDAQMVLAIGIGVFHICLAIVVKAVCYTSRFGFTRSLGTWGWTLLIVGGVIIGGLALMGVVDAPVVKWSLIILGIVSGVGIYLLNDLHRNPLLNIGSGLWDTYNTATGLLGDVLSYLRLYALGLAGGMLGSTFNMLAGMTLNISIPGINLLLFIIILVIGHSLNLALSCLGAFVHPLRLTFVEYFKNSGFEGTGRTYRPLK